MENYSFCLFRIPEYGGRVLWEITNTCNYCCKYCIFSSQNKKNDGELTKDEIYNSLIDLKKRNFTYIKFTGGEPFIRTDMIEILEMANNLGFTFDVSTNASLITAKIAKKIKNTSCGMVHVSLDGHDEYTHQFVRGNNTFTKTIEGIKNLVNADNYVRIGAVLYQKNQNHIEDIIKLSISLRANQIIFSYMESAGRMKDDYSLLCTKNINNLKTEISALSMKYENQILVSYSFNENLKNCENGVCPGGDKFIYVNNLGQISPCTWIFEHDKKYISKKSLKTHNVEELLNEDQISSYLSYIKKNIKGCPVKRR